ncbi:hypoxia induced protein conserved region-domain-containing protein [Rhodocollybia butyracea]|uniref:Hypoxia induced protein conserved region-domain-containing protein n=1 Tax=Rhodocollybia butyracea TaxID=206335 RepID=A0A9P5QAG6_9AGAR|nr:hypoxia induced protein conserved region-domain-containing protein [Rhodocollybia butyracea]
MSTEDKVPIRVPIDPNSRRWTEGFKEKAIRKTKENPWVPLGSLVTAGALIMAAVRLRQGNSRKFQVWLRYRVGFQALTIFAILGGLYKYGQGNLEENQRVMEQINQQRGEKQRAQERLELEQRIADAAQAQQEDELSGKKNHKDATPTESSSSRILGMIPWGTWSRKETVHEQSEAPRVPPALPAPTPVPSSNSGSSWWNVFSWERSSSDSAPEKPSKKDP